MHLKKHLIITTHEMLPLNEIQYHHQVLIHSLSDELFFNKEHFEIHVRSQRKYEDSAAPISITCPVQLVILFFHTSRPICGLQLRDLWLITY